LGFKYGMHVFLCAGISWNLWRDIHNAEQCAGDVFCITTESVLRRHYQLGTCCGPAGIQRITSGSVCWEGDAIPCQPSHQLDNCLCQCQPGLVDTWQWWLGECPHVAFWLSILNKLIVTNYCEVFCCFWFLEVCINCYLIKLAIFQLNYL